MFLNILFFYELSELWGGATSISDGIFSANGSLRFYKVLSLSSESLCTETVRIVPNQQILADIETSLLLCTYFWSGKYVGGNLFFTFAGIKSIGNESPQVFAAKLTF